MTRLNERAVRGTRNAGLKAGQTVSVMLQMGQVKINLARPSASRSLGRLRRLAELSNADEYLRSNERLRTLWETRILTGLDGVRLRPEFFFRFEGAEQKPVAARLMSRRGTRAIQLYLLAAFRAHCLATGRGRRLPTETPLRRSRPGQDAWLDLIPWPAEADPRARTEGVSPADNRLRQIKTALGRLQEEHLVTLVGDPRRADYFEHFRLMHESGDTLGTPIEYEVPKNGESYIRIPPEFFYNGWLISLEGTEIVTYLMFRHLQVRFSRVDPQGTFFRPANDRQFEYGIKKDAYESHTVLHNAGIIDHHLDLLSPPPSSDPEQKGRRAHIFSLNDEGLSQDGAKAVHDAVQNPIRPAVWKMRSSPGTE